MSISTLSPSEIALLTTTLEIIYDDKKTYDCHSCLNQFNKSPNTEPMLEAVRETKHCYQLSDKPITSLRTHGMGIDFYKCPGNFYRSINAYLSYADLFEKGVMPNGLPICDTPAKFVDVLNLVYHFKQEKLREQTNGKGKNRPNGRRKTGP